MSDPRTVRSSDFSSGNAPTQFAGSYSTAGSSNLGETQYVSPDQPTPPRGQPVPKGTSPAPVPPVATGGGGAPTMIMGGPRAEPSFAWLVIIAGPNNAQIGLPMPLRVGGTTSIGRVPGNDLVIPDTACSKNHVRIRQEPDENGQQVFVMYDLASANGVFAGTKSDYKDEKSRVYRHILHDGDYVLIGETTLVFKQI